MAGLVLHPRLTRHFTSRWIAYAGILLLGLSVFTGYLQAGPTAKGLLIYKDPTSAQMASCQYSSLVTGPAGTDVVRDDGVTFQLGPDTLVINVDYPSEDPRQRTRPLAAARVQQIQALMRTYPQFSAPLLVAQQQWVAIQPGVLSPTVMPNRIPGLPLVYATPDPYAGTGALPAPPPRPVAPPRPAPPATRRPAELAKIATPTPAAAATPPAAAGPTSLARRRSGRNSPAALSGAGPDRSARPGLSTRRRTLRCARVLA